jgi:glutathione S-transferase
VARPGSNKGRHVPSQHKALENRHKSEAEMDKAAAATRAWVQEGMKGDAKK